jgi:hypothetical protein
MSQSFNSHAKNAEKYFLIKIISRSTLRKLRLTTPARTVLRYVAIIVMKYLMKINIEV